MKTKIRSYFTPSAAIWALITLVSVVISIILAKIWGEDSNVGLTFGLMFASFAAIFAKIDEVLDFIRQAERKDRFSTELIASEITNPHWDRCRELFIAFNRIVESNNPLLIQLARNQIEALARFLSRTDDELRFFDEESPFTIKTHYTSFIKAIGKLGKYQATTIINFWLKEDKIIREFFHENKIAVSHGVVIERLFLITPEDKKKASFKLTEQSYEKLKKDGLIEVLISQLKSLENQKYTDENDFVEAIEEAIGSEQTIKYKLALLKSAKKQKFLEILEKHHRLSQECPTGCRNITTKVMEVETIDYEYDDYGIYYMEDVPMAVAIGQFEKETLELKGNKVTFNQEELKRRKDHFRSKFDRKDAVLIEDYLNLVKNRNAQQEDRPNENSANASSS